MSESTRPSLSELAELGEEIWKRLRLRTLPIGLRRLKTVEDMEAIPKIRRPEHQMFICQGTTLVRTHGWTLGLTREDALCCGFWDVGGFWPFDYDHWTRLELGYWQETAEDSRKHVDSMRKIPYDGYKALAIFPLSAQKVEPDVVLFYGNPEQMMMLCNGLQRVGYERVIFAYVGETSCTDSIIECYLTNKPAGTLPCYGARRMGHVPEDELELAVPPSMLRKTVQGLEALRRNGIKYPIARYGIEADASPTVVKAYSWYDFGIQCGKQPK